MRINLAPFCLPKDHAANHRLPGLVKPFRIGDWLYATDGRICVRVPARDEKLPTGRVAQAQDHFESFLVDACLERWPGYKWEWADDTSNSLAIPAQPIGSRTVDARYWLKVAMLGCVRFDPAGGSDDAIPFVCGPLQGLLMPLDSSTMCERGKQ